MKCLVCGEPSYSGYFDVWLCPAHMKEWNEYLRDVLPGWAAMRKVKM